MRQLGGKENYASRDVYEESKRKFCTVLGRHLVERFDGCDWGLVESGAASGSGLPEWLRGRAFTAVGATFARASGGTAARSTPRLFLSDTDEREANMYRFAVAALQELDAAIDERDARDEQEKERSRL